MQHIEIDEYVLDVLMPDLVGHDHSPAAFVVYLRLWTELYRYEEKTVPLSLQQLARRTGLSKAAVQAALRLLKRRKLVVSTHTSRTAVPHYGLLRHWVRRRIRPSL
jgi:hypothetical protein